MEENPQPTSPLLPPTLPYYATQPPHPYILLPSHAVFCLRIRRRRPPPSSCCLVPLLSLFLLVPLFVFLYPTDPDIKITKLHLTHLRISPPPRASFDLKLTVRTHVKNPNFFGMEYKCLNSSVSYRGKELGQVVAAGGTVRARGDSKLKADVEIDGVRVLDEVVFLIEDLAKGSVPLVTVTEVEGLIGVFFFRIPVKGKISCSLNVNPKTQKIIRQDCYPEVSSSN
ncbi:hypothetical protein LUZ60_010533 [Juncus effusus]|nr:hypothetical protein LUZ60_010533 [Juncus effusus]